MNRPRPSIDCSLYLVLQTDALRPGVTHEAALRAALLGGVTLVQLREKTASGADFLSLAIKSKAICDEFGVPLLINDRIDIALAAKADGVHIGQDDLPCTVVRRLLGSQAIIGVSANNGREALQAIQEGADYLGIGPCYDTLSKKDIKGLLGPRGVANILASIVPSQNSVQTVTIGGVNASNVRRVLHGAVSPSGRSLDGVAVVSSIASATDIEKAAKQLSEEVKLFKRREDRVKTFSFANDMVPLFEKVKQSKAVIQQITNTVVQNDSANATLALGCSPIMSANAEEAEDLAKIIGCLLINLGTLTAEQVEAMMVAGKLANQRRKPLVFDPVGVGASELRKRTTDQLMNHAQMTVIKGNAAEICTIAGVSTVASRGVDSGDGPGPGPSVVRDLARRERCIIAMTGAVDVISDGSTTVQCSNGHLLLGEITGSGCMTGSAIGCFAALAAGSDAGEGGCVSGDMLLATVAGITAVNVAAELAAARKDVLGPSTFRAALIDEIYRLTAAQVSERARIEVVDIDA